jgi:hypothetical protein
MESSTNSLLERSSNFSSSDGDASSPAKSCTEAPLHLYSPASRQPPVSHLRGYSRDYSFERSSLHDYNPHGVSNGESVAQYVGGQNIQKEEVRKGLESEKEIPQDELHTFSDQTSDSEVYSDYEASSEATTSDLSIYSDGLDSAATNQVLVWLFDTCGWHVLDRLRAKVNFLLEQNANIRSKTSSDAASNGSQSESVSKKHGSQSVEHMKKRISNREGSETPGDGEENGAPRKRVCTSGPSDRTDTPVLFGCPFYQLNPRDHQKSASCSHGWPATHRVKYMVSNSPIAL